MNKITESIRFMLGKEEFNLITYLDHPLWQVRVGKVIFRVKMLARSVGDMLRQVRRAYYIWTITH
ncbi:MAG: hypothetical protein PHO41_10930 [Eubacteriales bacterium]|nr:hypothetical protein [Eubacteriales bacterium]